MADAAHLEVKNLTKRFGGLVAVKDMSFSIEAGKILGGLTHMNKGPRYPNARPEMCTPQAERMLRNCSGYRNEK